jgi:diguanylate cyclase (GGDEF) domain
MIQLAIELVLQLIFIFGLLFLDFIVDLYFKSLNSKIDWKSRSLYLIYNKGTWLTLFILNIYIVQYLPNLNVATLLSNSVTSLNLGLQLLIILYFLYILEDKVIVYFNEGFSLFLFISYFLKHRFHLNEFMILVIIIFCIAILGELINENREYLIDREILYLVSCILYSSIWGIYDYYINKSGLVTMRLESYLILIILFTVQMYAIHLINKIVRKLWMNYSRTVHEANTDTLTKIGNRNAFEKTFKEVCDRYKNIEQPLSFAIFDIDYFKKINDTYGHKAGDVVLKNVAKEAVNTLMKKNSNGQCFRIGGEEFAIIFRGRQGYKARNTMVDIARNISSLIVDYEGNKISVNISVGISEMSKRCEERDELFKRVDSYLYTSKENGRKSITFEGIVEKY